MSWKKSTIGDILSIVKNGINCKQNKIPIGEKITRIETIAKKFFDYQRVGYASLTKDEKRRNKLKVGDILFSHINSPIHVGKTAIYKGEEDIYHGINLLLMRTISEVNPYFFNLYLNHLFLTGYWENNCKKSVNQASVNQKDISKIVFNYPPLPIQQKIVDKLDAIFAEIDKATAVAEANIKNAEALFQSYLNKIYDIKENLTKLKDCTKIKPPKSEIKILKGNTPVSFIPMESLGINNKFIISKQSKELEIVKGSYTYFKEDDILLAKITPCFENGKLGIANNLENGIGFGSSEYIVFRVNQNLDKEWLYYFLNRESFRRLGSKHMSGSVGHKRITKEFIEETLIPLIPISHQKKLVSNIDNLFLQSQRLKKASQNKISELFLLKNSILKQAFNGELVKAA